VAVHTLDHLSGEGACRSDAEIIRNGNAQRGCTAPSRARDWQARQLAVSSSIESDTFRDEVEDLSNSVARGPRSEAALTVLRGENVGALYPVDGDEMVIGRSTEVGITLPDDSLSRQHARIFRDGTKYMIEDLGSYVGYLNLLPGGGS